MREIKFRGICDERGTNYYGKWIHGYLGYEDSINPIEIVGDENIENYGIYDGLTFVNVRPETIGQFTGLKDKNGVEIYEGDIVIQCIEVKNPRTHKSYKTPRFKERMGIVEFKDGCFDFKSENYSGQIRCYIDHDKNEIQIEVVGNIHD